MKEKTAEISETVEWNEEREERNQREDRLTNTQLEKMKSEEEMKRER